MVYLGIISFILIIWLSLIPFSRYKVFFAKRGILFSYVFSSCVLLRCLAFGFLFFSVLMYLQLHLVLGVLGVVVGVVMGYYIPVSEFGSPAKVTYRDINEKRDKRKSWGKF